MKTNIPLNQSTLINPNSLLNMLVADKNDHFAKDGTGFRKTFCADTLKIGFHDC